MNYQISEASLTDIPDLIGLLYELFSIEKDFTPDKAKQERGLALIIANSEQGVIKVARDNFGKVIAMVSAQLVISTAQGARSAWVEDMVVSKSSRNAGIGKALLQSALDWAKAKGATRAQLLVDTENDPAIGYYHHLGWESTQLQARRIFLT
jgi:GNAT superfamily N-acetyltransferase